MSGVNELNLTFLNANKLKLWETVHILIMFTTYQLKKLKKLLNQSSPEINADQATL